MSAVTSHNHGYSKVRRRHDERQLDMFALFDLAPPSVPKPSRAPAFSKSLPTQIKLIKLLRYGYSLKKIAGQTGVAASTLYFWASNMSKFKDALKFGRAHGP